MPMVTIGQRIELNGVLESLYERNSDGTVNYWQTDDTASWAAWGIVSSAIETVLNYGADSATTYYNDTEYLKQVAQLRATFVALREQAKQGTPLALMCLCAMRALQAIQAQYR